MNKSSSLRLLLLSLFLGTFLAYSPALDVRAQTCTSTNSAPLERAGWLKGTTVPVYIDPAITGDRRASVTQAFNNWGAASGSGGNNSQVTYTFVNTPPPAGTGFVVSNAAPVTNPGLRAETRNYIDANGYTTHAETLLDPNVTDPAAVLEVMAHEIGHPIGLGDCRTCASADSVMAPGPTPGDYNRIMGRPTSPSPCDTKQVQGNYPPCTAPVDLWNCANYDPNTCTCREYYNSGGGGGGGGVGEGGGGGGFYDYCTPYYWYYYESYDGGQTWNLMDVSYAGCW